MTGFLAFVLGSFALAPFLGRDFFPSVDAGQILMHVRTQVGTRVEETANQFAEIQKAIRKIIPPDEIETLADNIGMPISGINMTYNNTGVIGSQDGDIQIKLREGPPADRGLCPRILREELPRALPRRDVLVPAGRHHQPDPEFRRAGADRPADPRAPISAANFAYAQNLLRRLRHVPGLADARIQQSLNSPGFNVDVDRTRAQYVGVTERDVTNSLVVNLAGSAQVAPTYYLNPDNGVSYSIVMQTPQYQIDSLNALKNLPITAPGAPSQTLGAHRRHQPRGAAAPSSRNTTSSRWCRSTPRRRAAISARSPADVQKVVDDTAKDVPKGAQVVPARPGADHEQRVFRACCSACSAPSC